MDQIIQFLQSNYIAITIIIAIISAIGTWLGIYINKKQKKNLPLDSKHIMLQDKRGIFEIDIYWGERKKAFSDIEKALENVNGNVFIAGIALRTITGILNKESILTIFASKINEPHSNFKIRIIACDTADKTLRPERAVKNKLELNIEEGKQSLYKFKESLLNKIVKERLDDQRPYLEITTYDKDIIPRHFILKVNNYIYVGSYLHSEDGKNSYIMRLKRIQKNENTKNYIGLYNLFINEIEYLESKCTKMYDF